MNFFQRTAKEEYEFRAELKRLKERTWEEVREEREQDEYHRAEREKSRCFWMKFWMWVLFCVILPWVAFPILILWGVVLFLRFAVRECVACFKRALEFTRGFFEGVWVELKSLK